MIYFFRTGNFLCKTGFNCSGNKKVKCNCPAKIGHYKEIVLRGTRKGFLNKNERLKNVEIFFQTDHILKF